MLHLDLLISPQQNQLDYLAARYHAPVVGNEWRFANEVGRGVLRAYALPLDFAAYTYELEVVQPLALDTVNPADSGIYCVFVNVGQAPVTKTVGSDTVTLRKDQPGGVFFYSPGNTVVEPRQEPGSYMFVCLTFTRQSMAPFLEPGSALAAYFASGRVFHVFEELTLDMEQQLRPLVGSAAPLDTLAVYSRVLMFWQLLVQQLARRQLARRQLAPVATRLLQPDVKQLFRARALLEENYQQVPSIEELAQATGMSATKLTRYFPQYFGRTIYQYAQYVRMRKARELLGEGRLSVSEVGFLVGYSSLTHFTNAFRKHFDVLPREVLRQGRQLVPVSGE
ncbi:helix-turn-helix domain-containing protein [Hymenobacter weizhouensis]|uniref:helix-turn-helix domain-containing protein n=1 Tax=Hymenobacter sp. YIM 151500-1 TaxID=2987689 RepID=UPI0022276EA3|nr:AraC family transcriptional regulator [Hymenobacter sp. YIM 151500-1]UYZ63792.1 AraC family transcriptional regulator [Hymenobacter sp. YIM 151500-1]